MGRLSITKHNARAPRLGSEFSDAQGAIVDENFWIRAYSFDTYLWFDEIEDVDPGSLDNTEDYFDIMKTFALSPSGNPKDKFHFTYNTEDWEKLSQSGISAGYGVEFFRVQSSPAQAVACGLHRAEYAGRRRRIAARLGKVPRLMGLISRKVAIRMSSMRPLFPESLGEVHQFVFRDVASGGNPPRRI